MADDERAAFIKAVTDVEKDYLAGKYESGSVVSAVVDDLILPLAAELAAANTRIAELEAEVQRWSDRMWASAQERMTWQHVVGEHTGDVPFQHCPVCEATFHRTENAALSARLERVRALVEQTPHKTTDHLGDVTGYLIPAAELNAALGEDA